MANLPAKPWKDAFDIVTDFTHVIVDNGTSKGKKITKELMKDILAAETGWHDPVDPGTQTIPATLPSGPSGIKERFEPATGFYKYGSATWEIKNDTRYYFFWNGTSWSLIDMGPLPKGEDGASLLKPWSESSADYPYAQNVQVRHDGTAYVSLVDNNATEPGTNPDSWQAVGGGAGGVPEWTAKAIREGDQVIHEGGLYQASENTDAADVPGVSPKWELKIAGYQVRESTNIYEFLDASGNILGFFDENGKFNADFNNGGIPVESVEGLKSMLHQLTNLGNTEDVSENLMEFRDKEGNILGHVNKFGEWNLPKLAKDSLKGVDPFNPYNVTGKREVHLPDMKFFRVDMYGPLPTDTMGDIGTDVTVVISYLGKKIVAFNGEAFVQGNISAGFSKKNYSVDILNDKGKSVDVKFGDWPVVDGFHFKGLQRDPTHTRDTGGTRVWREMARTRPYPYNFIKELLTFDESKKANTEFNVKRFFNDDAQYIGDGKPFELYYEGNFHGLYTWKLKKSRAVYAFDNRNQNHIQLDGNQGAGYEEYATYEEMAAEWEVKSPKTPEQGAKDNAMRIFQYWMDVQNGVVDLAATHQDYIHLIAWIDYAIWAQLIYHIDNVYNNHHIGTYDGTHWVPFPHDVDMTIGNEGNNELKFSQSGMVGQAYPYEAIRSTFESEIKERYTFLRKNGILTDDNFRKIYGDISASIPAWVYELDREKWEAAFFKPEYHSMDQIYNYLHSRLEFLDSRWLITE